MARITDNGSTQKHIDLMRSLPQAVGEEFQKRVQDRTPVITGRHRDSVVLEVRPDGFTVGSELESFPILEAGNQEREGNGMFSTTAMEVPDIIKDHMK